MTSSSVVRTPLLIVRSEPPPAGGYRCDNKPVNTARKRSQPVSTAAAPRVGFAMRSLILGTNGHCIGAAVRTGLARPLLRQSRRVIGAPSLARSWIEKRPLEQIPIEERRVEL
jgi:hypothetical protein